MQRLLALWLVLGVGLAAPLSDPTQDALSPSLALDSQDRPCGVWFEGGAVKIQHWQGAAWAKLPSPNTQPADFASLALDARDRPVLAWAEHPAKGAGRLWVARWTNSAWQHIGPSLLRNPGFVAQNPQLRLDQQGNPLMLWSEVPAASSLNHSQIEHVYLSRWMDTAWQLVDAGTLSGDVSLSTRSRDLVIGPQNRLFLAWSRQVLNKDFNTFAGPWDGMHWSKWGGSLNRDPERYSAFPSLALDAQGQPTVAFIEAGKGFDVWVKRWNGKGWYTLGQSVNAASGGAHNPHLALAANGNPVVAWVDNLGNDRLWVKHWDGSSWQAYGGMLNQNPKANVISYSLCLEQGGNPAVLWSEEAGKAHRVFLKRWNGINWVDLGNP